ncbi:MAG: multidrug transporter [Bacteroidota bacterium]|nr:multidrug transporter [Bacteroidota bacterium]
MSKQKEDDKFRRADTGRYTTEEYAKKHPKTTVKESPPKPRKK